MREVRRGRTGDPRLSAQARVTRSADLPVPAIWPGASENPGASASFPPEYPAWARGIKRRLRRLRDECLNEDWFFSLGQARDTIETWRLDYNAVRPHGALGDIPPEEFEQVVRHRDEQ